MTHTRASIAEECYGRDTTVWLGCFLHDGGLVRPNRRNFVSCVGICFIAYLVRGFVGMSLLVSSKMSVSDEVSRAVLVNYSIVTSRIENTPCTLIVACVSYK